MNLLSNEFLYGLSTLFSALCWILLLVLPFSKLTEKLLQGGILILIFSLIYTYTFFSAGNFDGGFSSLADIKLMFQNERILLASWIHILILDLVLGIWIARDAALNQTPRLWLSVSLILTFLGGPFGYVFHRFIRAVRGK